MDNIDYNVWPITRVHHNCAIMPCVGQRFLITKAIKPQYLCQHMDDMDQSLKGAAVVLENITHKTWWHKKVLVIELKFKTHWNG